MLKIRLVYALLIGSCLLLGGLSSHAQSRKDRKELVPPTRSGSAATGSAVRDVGKSPGDAVPAEELLEADKKTISLPSDETTVVTTITPVIVGTATSNPHSFSRYDALLTALTVFVLAIYVGVEIISKVPTTLHTPLMSGSNAISGITVVGAIIVGGYSINAFSSFLGFLAVVLAMINVVGGFVVTHRMLAMFKRK